MAGPADEQGFWLLDMAAGMQGFDRLLAATAALEAPAPSLPSACSEELQGGPTATLAAHQWAARRGWSCRARA